MMSDMVISDPGGFMLFFYDGWLSVLRILVIIILSYGAFVITSKSTSKTFNDFNAGQMISILAMGFLVGFSLLNMSIPIFNFLLGMYLLAVLFKCLGR